MRLNVFAKDMKRAIASISTRPLLEAMRGETPFGELEKCHPCNALRIIPPLTNTAEPQVAMAGHACHALEDLTPGKDVKKPHVAYPAHLMAREVCTEAVNSSFVAA
jgi:hypothetical protein